MEVSETRCLSPLDFSGCGQTDLGRAYSAALGNLLQVMGRQENARSGCSPVVITC